MRSVTMPAIIGPLSPRNHGRLFVGMAVQPFVAACLGFVAFPLVEYAARMDGGGRASYMPDAAMAFAFGAVIAAFVVTLLGVFRRARSAAAHARAAAGRRGARVRRRQRADARFRPDRACVRRLFSIGGPMLLQAIGALVAAAGLTFVGCAAAKPPAAPQPRPGDLVAAVDAARQRIEFHGGPIDVFVLGAELDPDVRRLLHDAGMGIDTEDAPKTPGHRVPARHFVLKLLRISGDRGQLVGLLGPVPDPQPLLLACGTTFNIDLARLNGSWQAKVVGLTVC